MVEMKRPNINCVEIDVDTYYAKFEIDPLERGFGITLGNSLRRILLSSLPGYAINTVKIAKVAHEFSTIPGVTEDVTDIILNLKQVCVKAEGEDTKELKLKVKGPCQVTAADIVCDSTTEIVNKDLHIAYIDDGAELDIEMTAARGRGYVAGNENKANSGIVNSLPIDSLYTPVKKANFTVEKTRVGQDIDYDKLTMEIWTNGVIEPYEALSMAAKILNEHLELFIDLSDIAKNMSIMSQKELSERDKMLEAPVEDLEFSVRSYNCLKRAGIHTVGDIVARTEHDMMKVRNLGKKSLEEVMNKVKSLGLEFKSIDE
ncbi:MAG: DNA-directed RNA polymerase subunit alpha [Clostridia bacterium]|nr:DNA-directed RNA polymerase subunit alpha [Clostridia bacterium]MDD4375953.1 DNA-directed RNA polymerase subunit alpha [Clostridia bacterium]